MKLVTGTAAVAACAAVSLSVPFASVASGAPSCPLPTYGPGTSYHPAINPADFTSAVTNPWFPLRPGTTFVYTGTKDGKPALDTYHASRATAKIDGVTTRVVLDRLFLDGVLEEQTTDYYAQDRCGNVWYFGEDTETLDRSGRVTDRSGSFHAGANGAEPGVFMQANPQLGRRFRQEWSPGQAEDTYRAVQQNASVSISHGHYTNALRTEETTALEPGVLDNKYYVSGVGEVEEVAVKGPTEKLILVDVLR
jgi:hypothetical protein